MFTIRKATTDDCALIRELAWQVFPETYKDIIRKRIKTSLPPNR